MYGELFITERLKTLNHIIKKLAELDVMVCLPRVIYSTIKLTLCSTGILYLLTLPMIHIEHIKKRWPKSLNSSWRLDCVDENCCYPILRINRHQVSIVLTFKKTAVIIVDISMLY